MEYNSTKKKRSVWDERDVRVLMELWAEHVTDLRRAKSNGHVYQEMSVQMANKFSPQEMHMKIKNLSQKYRDEKKAMGPSGGSPSQWKWFDTVHQIIGTTAANSAETVESFLYENTPAASPHASSESQPLASPGVPPSPQPLASPVPPSPQSPRDNAATSASAGKKRNHFGEVVKLIREQNAMQNEILKEQNGMLKAVVEDTQSLSVQIMKAIEEQNETAKQFVSVMKSMAEKM